MEGRQPRQGFGRQSHPLPPPPPPPSGNLADSRRMSREQSIQIEHGSQGSGYDEYTQHAQDGPMRGDGPTSPGARATHSEPWAYTQNAGAQQQPQYTNSPLQQPVYNPQRYADMALPTSQYAAPVYASPVRSHHSPPIYNPAAYQESPIAETTNRTYGAASGGYVGRSSPAQHPSRFQSLSTQASLSNENYAPPPPNRRNTADLGYQNNHRYTSSGPLPSIPFPTSYAAVSASPASRASPIRKRTPSPRASLQPSPQKSPSPSPYTRDNPSPSLFENPVDYASYDSVGNSPALSNTYPVTPERSQLAQSLQSAHSSGRHPHSRPLPGLPPEDRYHSNAADEDSEDDLDYRNDLTQDELFDELENAVMNVGLPPPHRRQDSEVGSRMGFKQEIKSNHNSYRSQTVKTTEYEGYGDDSDAEAEGGLAAMHAAEEQERIENDRRRSGGGTGFFTSSSYRRVLENDHGAQSPVIDEMYGAVDMTSLGGGYGPSMSYINDVADPMMQGNLNHLSGRHISTSSRSSNARDLDGLPYRTSSSTSFSAASVLAPYAVDARVDELGTGGFTEPSSTQRRLSFDEGDETAYLDDQYQGFTPGEGRSPGSTYPQPATASSHRPLPPPPSHQQHMPYVTLSEAWRSQSYTQGTTTNATASSSYQSSYNPPSFPRSISLLSHSSTPQLLPPIRAKTDAEERKRQTMMRASMYGLDVGLENLQVPVNDIHGLDLPTIPVGKRFQPSKLQQRDFDRCSEPWALSSIIAWLRYLAEGEAELKEQAIQDTLVELFRAKVPNTNIADAETLSARVVGAMYEAGTLVKEEEWLRFGQGTTSGVLYQLTGKGCYGKTSHEHTIPGRCYAFHCQRTVKKLDLQDERSQRTGDWATFYKLKKEDVENIDKKEIERQNVLHEIVQTEDHYMQQLSVLRTLYRGALSSAQPPILAPKKLDWFVQQVFGKLDPVQKANEEFLLPQLKYRQQEQGPWISGFADIFRDWIRKAKVAYIDYASNYPNASLLVKQENLKNVLFSSFLEGARNNKMSNKLDYNTFLKAPITRLQRYILLLQTVLKGMAQESEEKTNLQTAIDEIKVVTMECDTRVAESGRKSELSELASRLILRPEMKKRVELNLNHLGRELIFKGDLQRTGTSRFTWLETHALLFDNYLVLAKTNYQREAAGAPKLERYDVSKMPIPMDLLVLDSTDDPPVVKSSITGITPVSSSNYTATTPVDIRRSAMPAILHHSSTSTSISTVHTTSSSRTMVPTTSLEGSKDDKIMYPFRIRHLGKDIYTLFAPSAANRETWCEKIIEAKTKHAQGLYAQNAEPFKLRVLADTAFAYDAYAGSHKSILIKGTPLSRAIKEVEKTYSNGARPGPICRARVNCSTSFTQPYGKQMLAVGTDYGVFTAEKGNARGWTRVIPGVRVTQIAVLEEFNLFLLIADKSLVAYHIDVVCPVHVVPGSTTVPASTSSHSLDSIHKAPQKLSGAKDVHFFVTGRMKDRTLVFYKKRDGLSSIFKVLEPILAVPPSLHRRTLFRTTHSNPHTIAFREYDDFYIPADCSSLSLFNHSLAISIASSSTSSSSAASKSGQTGFIIMNLDKKTTWAVPDLKAPHVTTIAAHLNACDALAILRLDENEFLCVYDECAVYINKHGDVSRSVVMEFVGRAKAACLIDGFLVLFDSDFVEVRDATNGRLKQVIAGRDVRCLDDGRGGIGVGGSRTVKFALQHPEYVGCQVVMELVKTER